MTKQDILDYFSLIDFAYNESGRLESLSRMLDELLKEQETHKFFVDESGKITPLPVVVRCKDCKHRGDRNKCIVSFVAEKQEMPYFLYDNRGEAFCPDGKRKDT